MEKRVAHYDLDAIRAIVSRDREKSFTYTALAGIRAMGLTEIEALAVVATLSPAMLHKSMTTHADHRQWQDVYHALCPGGKTAYVKVTLREGAVVIQFKEK